MVDQEAAKNLNQNEEGNDSDNSDKIKELFEKMEDQDLDINGDLLLIQEVDESDENPYQVKMVSKQQ